MPPEPVDLRNAELPRAFRGYDIEATRQLLEDVADELKSARTKRDQLAQEVQRFEEQRASSSTSEDETGDKERLIGEALIAATRTAEDLREQGRRDGQKAIAEAEARARQILQEIEREREAIHADAEKQVRGLLDDAKAEARQLLAEGERERKELEAEAERLRALTDAMSANLRSLLAGMLEQLEGRSDVMGETADEPVSKEAQQERGDAALLNLLHPAPGERRPGSR